MSGPNTFTVLQNQDNGNFLQVATPPIALSSTETGQVAIGTGVLRTDSTKFTTAQPHDVILVNSTSNNVSVLLGNVDANGLPNGTFTEAPGSPIAVGKNPSSIIVADFNGDGIQDFAVTNKADNSISVFRGLGDGTFTQFPASPFLLDKGGVAETGPVAMVSGTFRQGDTSDLAVVNQTSGNVSILLDNIDPNSNITFTEAPNSPIAVGTSPVAIATGDLNADGVGDLAVVNQGDNTLSVLLGSTTIDGTFTAAPGSPLPTAKTPAGVQIASFAGGASPDIAVTNQGQSTLSVFLGLGRGNISDRSRTKHASESGSADRVAAYQQRTSGRGAGGPRIDDRSRSGDRNSRFVRAGGSGQRFGTNSLSRRGIYGYRFEGEGHAVVASEWRSHAATGI